MIHTDGVATVANYGTPVPVTRDDILELVSTTDLEGMAAEIFARLEISDEDIWQRLITESCDLPTLIDESNERWEDA